MAIEARPTAFVAFCALASFGWLVVRPDAAARTADKYMRARAVASGFSGAVLVARHGEAVFSGGYGYADLERKIRNDTDTRYRIGSITKSFVAVLVLELQEAGALAVSDRICRYVDPCPAAWQAITIHHLLSHTSGIPTVTGGEDYLEKTAQPDTRDAVIAEFRDLPLRFVPGERFEYSNANYHLLGAIVESVTGEPLADALAKRIFAPLGLRDTFLDGAAPAAAKRVAVGYRPDADGALEPDSRLDPAWSYAAGGVFSTVLDLQRFSAALDGDALLSTASKQAMWTPVEDTYGYGWTVRGPAPETLNRRVVMHSGRSQGYTACLVRFPDDDLTGIVLSNNVMADTCPIVRDLAAIVLGEPYTIPIARRAIALDPAVLDRYVGRYRLGDGLAITIERPEDLLVAQLAESPDRFPLYAESPTEFFLKTWDIQVEFATNRNGAATGMTVRAQGQSLAAKRVDD